MAENQKVVKVVPIWKRSLTLKESVFGLTMATMIVASGAYAAYRMMEPQYALSGFDTVNAGGQAGIQIRSFDLSGDDLFSLIPLNEIQGGGPAKDGIPALTDPDFDPASAAKLRGSDRVIGVVLNGEARAYPLRILNWHEIVNDTVGEDSIAVTYCPLCDSALVFDRKFGEEILEFGVSGLLYNSNVLMYDRQKGERRESLWSQMMLGAVVGPAAEEGLQLSLIPSQLTTWAAWKERHPDTTSLSFETGYRRNYDSNPYEGYFMTEALMFPVNPMGKAADDLKNLPDKEPVLIVSVGDQLKGYPVSRLKDSLGANATKLTDSFNGSALTFIAVDQKRETFEVYDESDNPVPIAFSFWFKFRTAHPNVEVFELGT